MTPSDTAYLQGADFRPGYARMFADSANDALAMVLRRRVLMIVTLILSIAGAGLALLAPHTYEPRASGLPGTEFASASVLPAIAGLYITQWFIPFFAMADSIRTVDPAFRMTFVRILGLIGYGLVVGLMVGFGSLFFIIPGIYLAIKFSQTPYAYLLRAGQNPMTNSWEMTDGRFWQTLLFYVFLSIVASFALLLPFYFTLLFTFAFPPAALILTPFLVAIWCYVMYFNQLVHVRWTEALLRSHELKAI